jgi:predicted transcriptional regulator of viral defense system
MKTYTHMDNVYTISFMARLSEQPLESSLAGLPAMFSYTEARTSGLSDRRLYALRDAGLIEPLGRGLFQRADAVGEAAPDLLEIAHRAPRATLCLITALARHGLTDAIPASIDVALPRGHRQPRTQAPATWHTFAPDTYDIGRGDLTLNTTMAIGLYDQERCIIDAFRLRHIEGTETAVEALRRWLRQPDTQPRTLLAMARAFPKAEPALRSTLEILL